MITGAADGMGLQIALKLCIKSDLALIDINQHKLDAATKKCLLINPNCIITTHICDVSDKQKTRDLALAVAARHKLANRTLLLFNNAGIGGGGSIVTSSEESFDKVMDIDWGGVYNCTRAFLPLMLSAPAAHIINTSSICGFYANVGYLKPNVSYSAAKFAVRGFTLALLTDFKLNAPHIKVSCVMPGWIGTGLIESSQIMLGSELDNMMKVRRKSGLRLQQRIHELIKEGDATTLVLKNKGLLDQVGDVDWSKMTDKQMVQMNTLMGPGFRSNALTSATQAAEIILKGVANDEWNILVGEDAHSLAKLMKEDEEALYNDKTLIPDFFNYDIWEMNRVKGGKGLERVKTKSKL